MLIYPTCKLPFTPESHIILLASSDGNVLKHGGAVLHEAGYNIVVRRNGFDVLTYMMEIPPCLLVIDEQLEQLTGQSVIHRLYAIPGLYRFPFIFLTRRAGGVPLWATSPDISGAVCFLTVPFNPRELLYFAYRCIRGILDGEFPIPK